MYYSENFAKPFQLNSFKSLDGDKKHEIKKRESVLFQQAEESEEDDANETSEEGGLKLPNETTWWTNATHERVG